MVSKESCSNNDEIDLMELAYLIWQGKWQVVIAVLLFFIVSIIYVFVTPKTYEITFPYQVNLTSVDNELSCRANTNSKFNSNFNCLRESVVHDLVRVGPSCLLTLEDKEDALVLKTADPIMAKSVAQALNAAAERLTQDYLQDAKMKLALINDEMPQALMQTEKSAALFLTAKTVTYKINKLSEQVLNFMLYSQHVVAPKTKLIMVLSVLLGGMAGVGYILLRHAFIQYRQQHLNKI